MKHNVVKLILHEVIVFGISLILLSACQQRGNHVLVFTKTKGWHHESIPKGIEAIQKLGNENNFSVDTTTDATHFNDDELKKYSAVIFLSTTGNVLNADQQVAFERYIQAGGGYVGIHAAADTEYQWPWYNKLVGAYFASHPGNPNVRTAMIECIDTVHQSMKGLPLRWERTDEWYNYKNIFAGIKVLGKLDEETYDGGEMGDNHPIAWYHEIDGGRSFYTGGGHTDESYSEPLFLKHVLGGIQYAMGNHVKLDYEKSYAAKAPEENRFTKTILANDLNEPMELAIAKDGRVFFAERIGNLYVYQPSMHTTKLIQKLSVMPDTKEGFGNGLLGLTIDPDYETNNYIYLFYTPDSLPAHQNISRFTVDNKNVLDLASEKVIIKVPLELEVSAHTGGSLAWDKDKNLYISTGDNTVPFASDGFAPIDETPGRIIYDAQRSAGNTNDLRGKVLKIHPEADGTYTIPEGNLFPKGTPQTRPEIYTMGCRNPYRISVDQETSILYWGEIGPDSGVDGKQGPKGYDEINQARKPGNYGWPYFVGDNKPYHVYNFMTKTVGALYDPNAPLNTSPSNTGIKNLPPTQKAMIWYPYDKSPEFPEVGTGGRSAIAGPVYHFDKGLSSSTKFPAYFNNDLFIYDWMRNWVFAVKLNGEHNFERMEPFMPNAGDFRRPIDMEIGPEGSFYMLEYGSVYGIDNVDARLVRIDYNDGNRKPTAQITASDTVGLTPLKISFKSKSFDFDEDDKLTYEWKIDGKKVTVQNPDYTFDKNGVYKIVLNVTDPSGASDADTLNIKVGNTLPVVAIVPAINSTFFFDKTPLQYKVVITDKEDKTIDPARVMIKLKYIPKAEQLLGHQQLTSFNLGKSLMAGSDCKACHQLNGKSVGPAFIDVSIRYKNDKTALPRLAQKVITGGTGVWGDHGMNAHPQLSVEQATEIVKYVLSLADQKQDVSLPLTGTLTLNDHKTKDETGRYALTASYTDNGGELKQKLTNTAVIMLRSSRVQAEDADKTRNASLNWGRDQLGGINNKSFFMFKNIDLKNIKSITYHYASKDRGARIEVHTQSAEGPVISTLNYEPTGDWNTYKDVTVPVQDPGGVNDLYFVFRKEDKPNKDIFNIDWVEFKK